MLIEFNVQNVLSFNSMQNFSMLASTSTKEELVNNIINVNKFGIDKVLKSSALFGANAGGKTNFIHALTLFSKIILNSLLTADSDVIKEVLPFFLKDDIYDIPTELEVSFIKDNILYRYGLSILEQTIVEEWLYRNTNVRETMLFHREGQEVKYNKKAFSEIKDFINKNNNGSFSLTKTKNNVPLISVLSQFDGKISSQVVDWFKNIRIISGLDNQELIGYTIDKFETDKIFKQWALEILKNFQIKDIYVKKFEVADNNSLPIQSTKVAKQLIITKEILQHNEIEFPLFFESEGTKKIIHCLAPIYDVLKHNRILLIDEFDTKFHTLLSKYLLQLIHDNNKGHSQLIISTHDTNLLTKEIFRRDQIWFVEKNDRHESELFSLIEYKEHYTRKNDSYSKDYLVGKYGAIPLFANDELLKEVLND